MKKESTTKEILGENSQTIWVFGQPMIIWLPLMNPQYLTENNLWGHKDTYDFSQETIDKFSKIIKYKGEGDAYDQACEYVAENIDYGSMDNMDKLIEELITSAKNKL
jgi:hypothetical protein